MSSWLQLVGLVSSLSADPAPVRPQTCAPLPTLSATPFRAGETLVFHVNAIGARAGKMTLYVLPSDEGLVLFQGRGDTNGFLSRFRRVSGEALSKVEPTQLRPRHFAEHSTVNDIERSSSVDFAPDHTVRIRTETGDQHTEVTESVTQEVWDPLATLFLLRELPYAPGLNVCLTVYGSKHLWRLTGQVLVREHLSIELGEFDAWHLTGEATQVDDPKQRRTMDVWISDDAHRLPLIITAGLDVGGVKATLEGVRRPGEAPAQAPSKLNMRW